MFAVLLAVATLVVAGVAAIAPLRLSFTLLLASIVLVPTSLTMPNGVTSLLEVHRVVLLGTLAGLLWRHRRQGLWRLSPTALAFLLYLVVVLFTGIVAAPVVLDIGDQLTSYLGIVEQLLVLLTCTALVRADPDPVWYLRPLAGVLLVSAGIGGLEHLTGGSWSHWLFQAVPSQQGSPAASELARRAGTVRVRAGNEFPLGFAWVCAALLPAFLVVAVRLRRWRLTMLSVGTALVVAAVYWSFARSAIIGVFAAVAVLGLLARDRRVGALVVVAAALGAVAYAAAPALSHHFSSSIDAGSISVRRQRIPLVLGAVSDHPWTGLGLTGLHSLGLQGTDATYLLTYGETGAGGLAALAGLLVVALIGVGRGALTQVRELRLAAAAMFAGVLALIVAGGAFDAMALLGTADVLWVLVAVGIAVSERSRGPVLLWAAPPLLPPIAAVAALVGVGFVILAPTHYAQQAQFSTLPLQRESGSYDPVDPGNTLVNTACAAASAQAHVMHGVSVSCRNLFAGPGVGEIRLEASSPRRVVRAVAEVGRAIRRAGVTALDPVPETPVMRGIPTAATTAPLWLPLIVVMMLFAGSGEVLRALVPRGRRRLRAP